MAFTIPFIFTFFTFLGMKAGGVWSYFGPMIVLLIHPVLDSLIGEEKNDRDDISPEISHFLLSLYAFIQLGLFLWALHFSSQITQPLHWLGVTLSIGVLGGAFGLTVGHELIHRPEKYLRTLGIALLAQVNYTHFRIEHIFIHHRHVGTPLDPATARKGEGLYIFLFRSFTQGLVASWKFEKKRVGMSLENRMIHYLLLVGLLTLAITFFYGAKGFLFFALQSGVAIFLVVAINYIEHYGLSRKKTESGRFEAVTPKHSWDAAHFMTNKTLFNLGRHSHHHAVASVPFGSLRNKEEAPKLGIGYSMAILLSLVPPLWFRFIHPKLAKIN